MEYRREIDGLRAIAVIPVILFHAGFSTFSGGFVGVDVFFVISGYLITSIILAELEQGTFSIVNFYERRARRILPALFTVMFVSLPFAWMWLFPSDMKDFSQSLVSVSLFASNVLFWLESGYFETAAELKPLLHTWSLGVEEQYYILFPLFLMLVWRFRNRWILGAIIAIGVISLGVAQYASSNYPSANFYLLPTRAWELMIGGGLAFVIKYGNSHVGSIINSKLIKETFGLLGLLLIGYAVLAYDKETPFPSVYALVPTLGTALVILFATTETSAGRLLANKPLVFVGLISYSAYLWHQPLFAFARHHNSSGVNEEIWTLLIVTTFIFAFVSWRFIEKPFRNKHQTSRSQAFSLALIFSVLFIVVGIGGHVTSGFLYRLNDDQNAILAFANYDKSPVYREGSCFLKPEQDYAEFAEWCEDDSASDASILLWGDSHAAALSYGLRAQHGNVTQFTASGCPPIKGFDNYTRVHCKGVNEYVLERISHIKPEYIFLHANWLYAKEYAEVIELDKTLAVISSVSPQSKIYVVGGVPQWQPSLPVRVLRAGMDLSSGNILKMDRGVEEEIVSMDALIGSQLVGTDAVFLSAIDEFCNENGCLAVVKDNEEFTLIAWDYGHLTAAGSELMAKGLIEHLKQ